jgi:hypothetical protein
MENKLNATEAARYFVSGDALFTIRNPKTGGEFTFAVYNAANKAGVLYVKAVDGKTRTYMGAIVGGKFRPSGDVMQDSPMVKAFDWLLARLSSGSDLNGVEFIQKAVSLTPEKIAEVHAALRTLANVCDGAVKRDHMGFNGRDSEMGHNLAGLSSLTPMQAGIALRMLRKYGRQVRLSFVDYTPKPKTPKTTVEEVEE